jgi:hypothetical protein
MIRFEISKERVVYPESSFEKRRLTFIKNSLNIINLSLKPALTTTSEQWPPVSNGWFDSSMTSLNLPFSGPKDGCCAQV